MTTTSHTPLRAVVRKVTARLIPILLLMYILAFLDRSNLGFARVQFQADTGLSDAAYALGAGIFFLGYALLEVPSNMLMRRFGAKAWLARIMISWGIVSALMMFATEEWSFYALRVLLGITEAGFFPGVIYFLTQGGPANPDYRYAGSTDILITWLYKLTLDNGLYDIASVMSILIFVIVGSFSVWSLRRSKAFTDA